MSSRHIRVAVSAMPRLLRDIIEGAVNLAPDMCLITAGDGSTLSLAIKSCAVDVVILGEQPARTASSHRQLLVDNPLLKIVVVTDDGCTAHVVEFRRIPVAEMSPTGLVDAIRAAVSLTGTGNGADAEKN
jgi:hypothetical protein